LSLPAYICGLSVCRRHEQEKQQRQTETEALARKSYVYAFSTASTVAYTGDKEQTLKHLEQSDREHDPDLIGIQNERLFDFLH
jgi:hypothetical protein